MFRPQTDHWRSCRPAQLLYIISVAAAAGAQSPDAVSIGSRLELFADRFLIDSMSGVSLELHEPAPQNIALRFDRPYEGRFSGYVTVLHEPGLYRMYYRGLPEAGADGSASEVTCYAESKDGITWYKPVLGLYEIGGRRDNNVVLAEMAPFSHNFAPFIDANPACAPEERFKAIAGTSRTGLHAFVSADGISWRSMREEPIITAGAFDSQNIAFWSEAEQRYLCYFRTWSEGEWSGYRTVSRSESHDFRTWTEPKSMTFGDTPMEHLYTNQTQPYFRAPHLYIALPMRFMPGRQVLTLEQARELGVHAGDDGPGYAGDCADAVFMTSRGGYTYDRTFMEAFIRPGTDLGNWASRAGMAACGISPTGPAEISIYKQAHYAQPTAHLLRYALRTDGFASVHAGYGGGEFTTRALLFEGSGLSVNFATSAAGEIRIALENAEGGPIDGFGIEDADPIIGDLIERMVTWRGNGDITALAGTAVRLRVVIKDADLYALRFK